MSELDSEMRCEPEGMQVLEAWEALQFLQNGVVLMCCLSGGWGKVRLAQIENSNMKQRELQVFQPGFSEKLDYR
jgi:hypothetical protein